MARSLIISLLSFPFSGLAFVIGWAARDVKTGLLAGAIVFTCFFIAAAVNLFLIKTYSYLDTALPVIFAVLWSLALAPFSLGASLFSAPFFIAAAVMLSLCMLIAKRYDTDKGWLITPALVFLYEMLPINIPGFIDDTFAVTGAAGVVTAQFLRNMLPKILKYGLRGVFQPKR